MRPRYKGCYRGPGYTKITLLEGRVVLCVYQYRRSIRLKKEAQP